MALDLRLEHGRRLRERREQAGMSSGEVALKVGMDKAYYRRIELGEIGARGPGDGIKQRIAAALGVRVEEIWSYPDTRNVSEGGEHVA